MASSRIHLVPAQIFSESWRSQRKLDSIFFANLAYYYSRYSISNTEQWSERTYRPLSVSFLLRTSGKETEVATLLDMKNMGDSILHPENVNIWSKTGQNQWWQMLRSGLAFSDFNFMHYWGQGGPFSPGDCSNSSQRSFGQLKVLLLIGWGFWSANHSREHTWAEFSLEKYAALWWSVHIHILVPQDLVTFVRKLSDHLVKRGPPDLNNTWNWNMKRPNPTSAYAIIDLPVLGKIFMFSGWKIESPIFFHA